MRTLAILSIAGLSAACGGERDKDLDLVDQTIVAADYEPYETAPCAVDPANFIGTYALETNCGAPAKAQVEVTELAFAEDFPIPIAIDEKPGRAVDAVVGEVHPVGTATSFWEAVYLFNRCEGPSGRVAGGIAVEIVSGEEEWSCYAGINGDQGETEPCARIDDPDWARGGCTTTAVRIP